MTIGFAFDCSFAVLVAAIAGWTVSTRTSFAAVAGFVAHYDRARERCFVAERAGAIVGSVLVVKKSARVARLRLLLVEPSARGLGLGARLVDECIRFARAAGYRQLELWTNSVLVAARRVYERAGFTLVASGRHQSFGKSLVEQTFRLAL